MTYLELYVMLHEFNSKQLNEPVVINLGGINQNGSYIYPAKDSFVYSVE